MKKSFAVTAAVLCCLALRAQSYGPAWESLILQLVEKVSRGGNSCCRS
ncbi:hypothetical protein ACQ86N_24900 [Puia sp. P3]